jgi:predicted MFS family arabinose efflux permease
LLQIFYNVKYIPLNGTNVIARFEQSIAKRREENPNMSRFQKFHSGPRMAEWKYKNFILLSVLASINLLNYVDRISLSLLLEPIKKELLLSDSHMGLLSGVAFSLFYALLGIPIARIADKGGKAWLLPLCVFLWSLMTMASGVATSFGALFLARMFVGVGEAGCAPTSFSIIAENIEPKSRPLAISIFQAVGLLGVAIGMISAGYVAEAYGWRMAMMLVGAAGIPVAILAGLILRGYPEQSQPDVRNSAFMDIGQLLAQKAFRNIVFGIALAAFGSYSVLQWLPAYFMRLHQLSISQVGLLMGLSTGGGGIVGMLCGGFGSRRIVAKDVRWDLKLPAITYAVSVPLFLAMLAARSTTLAIILNFAATAVSASGGGIALAALQRFTGDGRRATANALMLMISAIFGVGLGPVFVGYVSDISAPYLGADSLRFALGLSTLSFAFAAFNFWRALRD